MYLLYNSALFTDIESLTDNRPGMRGGHQMCVDVLTGTYSISDKVIVCYIFFVNV